jgi:hypothetical protein
MLLLQYLYINNIIHDFIHHSTNMSIVNEIIIKDNYNYFWNSNIKIYNLHIHHIMIFYI